MFQITKSAKVITRTNENELHQSIGKIGKFVNSNRIVNKKIKNLSTIIYLAKFKKWNLTKSKKPNLAKSKRSNFIKNNLSGTDFLILKAKKVFIYLQESFTKIPILHHFEPEHHLY